MKRLPLTLLALLLLAGVAHAQDKFSGGSSVVPPLLPKVDAQVFGHDAWVGAYSAAYSATGAYSDTLVIRRDLNGNGTQVGSEIVPLSGISVFYRGTGTTNADSLKIRIHNSYSASDTSVIVVCASIYNPYFFIPVRCAYACIKAKKAAAAARDFLTIGWGGR